MVVSALLVACGKITDDGAASADADDGGDMSEECPRVQSGVDEVQLRTQADVDALQGVHTVEGSLVVTGSVTDLSPLACLKHVKGDLRVYETEALRDLQGLEQLETIEGSLYFGGTCETGRNSGCHGNVALSEITALKKLLHVSSLYIEPTCFVEGSGDCVGGQPVVEIRFEALEEIVELILRDLPSLVEVRFDALQSATRMVVFGDMLERLLFPELTEVAGLFHLGHALKLKNLDGFLQLSQMSSVVLRDTGLTDLSGLGATHLASLDFIYNNELVTLAGLESLQEVDSMNLFGNERLESLEGLGSLHTVGDVDFTLNPALASLDGFQGLTHAETIFIQSNYALTDISGLHSLETVEDSLIFWTNTLLPHCEGDRLRDLIGEENIGAYAMSGGDETAACDP